MKIKASFGFIVWAVSLLICTLSTSYHAEGQTFLKDSALAKSAAVKPLNTQAVFLPNTAIQPIASNLYVQHFGFFCRQELKMEQAHIPVHFRLGSKTSCDKLEGKNKNSGVNDY